MTPVLPVVAVALWAFVSQAGPIVAAADSLTLAKSLYASANYEEALEALSAVDPVPASDEADQYRALCLLALGRMDEVDRLLQALVVRNPLYRMSNVDVSPRLVVRFEETRKRLLPGILNATFTAAQATFQRARYAEASSRFRTLLTLLASEDAAPDQDGTVRRDLKQVAEGFLSLSEAALSRAVAPSAEALGPAAPPDPAALGILQEEAAIGRVVRQYAQAYSALDAGAVRQVFRSENARPLELAFNRLKSQTIEARNVTIAIDGTGASAVVNLTWVVDAVPKVGNRSKAERPATLRMLKSATGEWTIVERR